MLQRRRSPFVESLDLQRRRTGIAGGEVMLLTGESSPSSDDEDNFLSSGVRRSCPLPRILEVGGTWLIVHEASALS